MQCKATKCKSCTFIGAVFRTTRGKGMGGGEGRSYMKALTATNSKLLARKVCIIGEIISSTCCCDIQQGMQL